MLAGARPLSPGAQDCYLSIGRNVPRRLNRPVPPLAVAASTVGAIAGQAQQPSERPYTEADFQRHLRGDGPCPFGCCGG